MTVQRGPRKPSVALKNEKQARENICAKLTLLRRLLLLAQEEPRVVEEGDDLLLRLIAEKLVPNSIRQFNAFDSSLLPEYFNDTRLRFGRNANATLNRYPELRSDAQVLIEQFRRTVAKNPSTPPRSKGETVARLRRKIDYHRTIRLIAERELAAAREQVFRLQDELKTLKRSISVLEKRSIGDAAQIAAVVREKAELLKKLEIRENVYPIRKDERNGK